MIISRTPLRISFVGGGSDLPAFYEREPGAVVSTCINKYVYIAVNPKFDGRIRVSYLRTELVDRVDDLVHELVREALKLLGIAGAIEIVSISDIPSRGTGLGSSSSYTVGVLHALRAYQHERPSAEQLAHDACLIEMERCGKPIGKQDPYIAAYGGLQHLTFESSGSVRVDPIPCAPETLRQLQERLLLLYTGSTRSADAILHEQAQATRADDTVRTRLRSMVRLAGQLREALGRNELDSFGEILHANWSAKRQLTGGISSPGIDAWYDTARAHGAIGGKILGAGGGGFLLLYAPPDRHRTICQALAALRPVPFHFEAQGSRLVYLEDNGAAQ